jgi:tetratricopeptide (TPR) repeat protein
MKKRPNDWDKSQDRETSIVSDDQRSPQLFQDKQREATLHRENLPRGTREGRSHYLARIASIEMAKIGRNEPCPCGSGKKYKQCCLAKDEVARSAPSVAAQADDHLPHHHPRFCKNCNANIDAAARGVLALIDAGKLDAAEQAAQAMMRRWPDIHDGYDCFGMVCEARGNNREAADYYRKVIAMAREEPSFYEHDFAEYYEKLIRRLDPASMGARPPNPRDI